MADFSGRTAPASLLSAERIALKDAARELGCSLCTLHRWHRAGVCGRKLRFVRLGWRSFVLRDELEQFIAGMSDPKPESDRADDFAGRAAAANERAVAMGL